MSYKIAGIDVNKKVLMVVVMDAHAPDGEPERRRFATMPSDLERFATWLREREVKEAVMESTAQYWRSVWLELEPYMRLQLAQAFSNRAPRGRKHDFKDAERLVRRLIANELILSFVPKGEQRTWCNMTRMKTQLTRDRVRLQSQLECLLEEMRIKLSSVVSDLLGVSGLRILWALARGESDPKKLAALGEERLQCGEEQLIDALTGRPQPMHRELLSLQLERLQLIDEQIAKLNGMIAQAMKPHQETVVRLAEVPGFGVDSAQQVIAEVGVKASTFPSAAEFTSWVGTCPGKDESAEENHSSRSAKGNKYLRRVLNQAAHAAVKKNGSHFQAVFRRLLPRLGYQSAIWAIDHRLCRVLWRILHEGVRFIEQGSEPDPQAKKQRARTLARALRKLGYNVAISPINPPTAEARRRRNDVQLQGDFRRSVLASSSRRRGLRKGTASESPSPAALSKSFHRCRCSQKPRSLRLDFRSGVTPKQNNNSPATGESFSTRRFETAQRLFNGGDEEQRLSE